MILDYLLSPSSTIRSSPLLPSLISNYLSPPERQRAPANPPEEEKKKWSSWRVNNIFPADRKRSTAESWLANFYVCGAALAQSSSFSLLLLLLLLLSLLSLAAFLFSFFLTDPRRVTARTSISDKDVVISPSLGFFVSRPLPGLIHRNFQDTTLQCCTHLYIYIYIIRGRKREKYLLLFHLYWLYYDDKGNADPFIRLSKAPRFPRNRVWGWEGRAEEKGTDREKKNSSSSSVRPSAACFYPNFVLSDI